MKKILMSLMAIVITIITVGTMYIYTLKLENKYNDNNYIKRTELKNEESIGIKNKTNENQKGNENDKNNKPIDNKTNKDDRIEKVKENKDNSSKDVEKKENISVFKVNKHTLLQKLPVKDKIKLLYMCKGLSTIDMANIKEYMKSSNEIEASSEIFKILRQRLSKEEYNEIKKILSPYVNIEYIENNM